MAAAAPVIRSSPLIRRAASSRVSSDRKLASCPSSSIIYERVTRPPRRRAAARADGDEERARGALARIALGGTNGNGSGDEGEINVTLTTSLVRRDQRSLKTR